MKFTESWLRKWVNPNLTAKKLAEQLTLTGLETEISIPEVARFSNIVVGQVSEVLPHPNADRLSVCIVDCGIKHIPQKTIICGASNVRVGLRVATALPEAKLPNGLIIQKRVMRGVASEGMLCSIGELGLAELFSQVAALEGIWELPSEMPLGADLWEQLHLEDPIFDVQIPPNRGDCLSLVGIAREVAALNALDFSMPVEPNKPATLEETISIHIEAQKACPRYTGCIIRGLDPTVKTPFWMMDRLQRSGIRSIHPIVDITNYILLEWGAPLHAFDLNKLSGAITVRFARPRETLTLLNEKTVTLAEDTLVIADESGPQAIAGVMGGLASAVSNSTVDIFLESAFFKPTIISGRARYYGLMTDASYRFERGVDPRLCQQALARTSDLLVQICGGQVSPIIQVEETSALPPERSITLTQANIVKILGVALPSTTVIEFLTRLGMKISFDTLQASVSSPQELGEHENWQVTPPSWRFDIKTEIDLIEELARLYGYEHIPAKLPVFPLHFQQNYQARDTLTHWRRFWAAQGYHETIHYSFTSAEKQKLLDPNSTPVVLENPISAELGVLRTSLWPNLLSTLVHNQNHQQKTGYLFEVGTVFRREPEGIVERPHVAGLAAGNVTLEQWGVPNREIDFFDIKQMVQNSLTVLDPSQHYRYVPAEHPALHPGQSSQLYQDDSPIGWIGALHPKLYSHFDMSTTPVYLFEWQLNTPITPKAIAFKPFSRFPLVRRDLAFWIPKTVPFEIITKVIQAVGGEHLRDLTLFDVYQPDNDPSQHSLALGLIWQHSDRTLTDQEIEAWQTDIITALQTQCNGKLRHG